MAFFLAVQRVQQKIDEELGKPNRQGKGFVHTHVFVFLCVTASVCGICLEGPSVAPLHP